MQNVAEIPMDSNVDSVGRSNEFCCLWWVAAAFFGWWIFAEAMSRLQILGGGLILLGVWLARPRQDNGNER